MTPESDDESRSYSFFDNDHDDLVAWEPRWPGRMRGVAFAILLALLICAVTVVLARVL